MSAWYAYPTAWAEARALRAAAARWQRRGLLSAAQQAAIEAAYPLPYYRPAWPLRLALFFFTWLGMGLGGGLVLAISLEVPLLSGLLLAGGCLALAEVFIREQKAYYAGVDNALLYCGLGAAVASLWYVLDLTLGLADDFTTAAATGLALPLGLALTLALLLAAARRYADPLVTAAAYLTALAAVVYLLFVSTYGLVVLPLALMAFGYGTLRLHRTLARRLHPDYYATALLTLKVLALATIYLSGNYFVGGEFFANLAPAGAGPGPLWLQVLFIAFTAIIPPIYLSLGLRRHDRPLLLVGLAALAFSLFTLRYYRAVLPPELAATLGGAALIVLAGTLLRYLRPQRHTLTSEPDDEPRFLNLESFVVVETAPTPSPPAPGFGFGGGQSGGGGATGSF